MSGHGLLYSTAGWMMILAVAIAPILLGARPPLFRLLLSAWLLIAATAWAAAMIRRWARPQWPFCMILSVAWLLTWGLASLLNPRSSYDASQKIFEAQEAFAYLPSTVDVATSIDAMIQTAAVLVALVCLVDLFKNRIWQVRAVRAIACAGGVVFSLGLIGSSTRFGHLHEWIRVQPFAHAEPFGTFDYQGNAGSFINLVVPAIMLNWGYARAVTGPGYRSLSWLILMGLAYLALLANASRAALLIGIVASPSILFTMWYFGARRGGAAPQRSSQRALILFISFVVMIASAGLVATGGARSIERLKSLPSQLRWPYYPRYMEYREACRMIGEKPYVGFGVGVYKLISHHTEIGRHHFAPPYTPGEPFTVQHHVNQDYLQTCVEWGILGSLGWVLLVGGACASIIRMLFTTVGGPMRRLTMLAAAIALGTVFVHALVDCPLQVPALQLTVVVYLALAWSSSRWARDGRTCRAPAVLSEEK